MTVSAADIKDLASEVGRQGVCQEVVGGAPAVDSATGEGLRSATGMGAMEGEKELVG